METIKSTVLLLCLALGAPAYAAGTAPDALLKATTSEVVAAIKQNREQGENPARLAELLETKVLPLFDFSRMTQLAAGRTWRNATAAQQDALTAEFRTLLVGTYSSALASYRDQPIHYKPLRMAAGDTDVTVRSEVKQGGSHLKLDYEMVKTREGWRIYDVKLNGVSLVTAYRPGFTAKVRDVGMDGLILALKEKNRLKQATRIVRSEG